MKGTTVSDSVTEVTVDVCVPSVHSVKLNVDYCDIEKKCLCDRTIEH